MNPNYIITVFFLLLSSKANLFFKYDIFWFLLILYLVWFAFEKKLILKREVNFFIVFTSSYLAYVLFRNVTYNHLSSEYLLSDILFLFKYLLVSFLFCLVLKEKAIEYIIRVVRDLTVISFFFYAMQLVGLGSLLYSFMHLFDSLNNIGIPGYTNDFIFTFTQGRHDFRNSGFVWEPGAFGCFLIITLMFHFFRNDFTFDKTAKIFIVGIITTLSTTNYLALFILLFLMYRYRVRRFNFAILLLIPLGAILFMTVPILGEKITQTMNDDSKSLEDMQNLSRYYTLHNVQIPLNRFASMTFLYDNFGAHLIMGISNKYDEIVNQKFNVNISNGIFDFLAKFGVIGLLFLIYRYLQFCKAYLVRNELAFYCLVILMVLAFGEPILFLPICMIFLFLPISGIDYEHLWSERNEGELVPDPTNYKYGNI